MDSPLLIMKWQYFCSEYSNLIVLPFQEESFGLHSVLLHCSSVVFPIKRLHLQKFRDIFSFLLKCHWIYYSKIQNKIY